MAAFLKRKHELIALKVFLEFDQRHTWVRALLESHEGGTPNFRGEWRFSVSELGLPRHFNPRDVPPFALPECFGSGLALSLAAIGIDDPGHPLWLCTLPDPLAISALCRGKNCFCPGFNVR